MRRASVLTENGSVVLINKSVNGIRLGSNSGNSLLQRTWHESKPIETILHAKFNSQDLSGFHIIGYCRQGERPAASHVQKFEIFRVADSGWIETHVIDKIPSLVNGRFEASVSPLDLGINELSGAETYAIKCIFIRGRKKISKKIYVNHLGCFDNIQLIRREIYYSEGVKGDE